MNSEIKIAYTGGGTGGHIFPLLAVSDEVARILSSEYLQKRCSFYYFGDPGPYRNEFISRSIKIVRIGSSKLRRYFSLMNFIDAVKFPFLCLQALIKMLFIMPDVLFSKGGTGALPVVMSAWIFRIPIIIHESDSIPGLTNSVSAKFANRVAVAFKKASEFFSNKNIAITGNPIRKDLLRDNEEDLPSESAKRLFGFDPNVPLLLIMGGSQGSRRLNDFILDNAMNVVRKYQVLHQTGEDNFESFEHEINLALKDCIKEEKERYKIVPFLKKDMKQAYEACDIIISRAGSGAIFEAAYFGKPSILIPLPEAGRNHQFYNAFEYAEHGAAIVIEEGNLKPALFFDQIEKIIKEPGIMKVMQNSAFEFRTPFAAEVIADEIVRLAND